MPPMAATGGSRTGWGARFLGDASPQWGGWAVARRLSRPATSPPEGAVERARNDPDGAGRRRRLVAAAGQPPADARREPARGMRAPPALDRLRDREGARAGQVRLRDAPARPALDPADRLHRRGRLDRAHQPDADPLLARRPGLRRREVRDHQGLRLGGRDDAYGVRGPPRRRPQLLGSRPARPRARPVLPHQALPLRRLHLRPRAGLDGRRAPLGHASSIADTARRRPAPPPTAAWSPAGWSGCRRAPATPTSGTGPRPCSSRTGASSTRPTRWGPSRSARREPVGEQRRGGELQLRRLRAGRGRRHLRRLNACGDPGSAQFVQPAPPTAEGGSLRSQDLRTMSTGTIVRVPPDRRRARPPSATGGWARPARPPRPSTRWAARTAPTPTPPRSAWRARSRNDTDTGGLVRVEPDRVHRAQQRRRLPDGRGGPDDRGVGQDVHRGGAARSSSTGRRRRTSGGRCASPPTGASPSTRTGPPGPSGRPVPSPTAPGTTSSRRTTGASCAPTSTASRRPARA